VKAELGVQQFGVVRLEQVAVGTQADSPWLLSNSPRWSRPMCTRFPVSGGSCGTAMPIVSVSISDARCGQPRPQPLPDVFVGESV